ncbi:MAG: OmpA family protein [Deltaproteobacteria bacterium]|nr:OmpA family protein [Deltaproteobacteria bacterium]
MSKSWVVVLMGAGLIATVGCASSAKAPPQAPTQPVAATSRARLTPQQEQAVDQAQGETGANGLSIDDAILKLCPAVTPPRFDYDSARLKSSFRDTMASLAECMRSGGLRDKEVLLVGHADIRGEEDYNMSLGGRRAQAVRAALQSFGIEERRVDLTSRGALDAIGTDESGWAKDRRVDIKLKM